MDARQFARILSDKNILNLKKLHHKYPEVNMDELLDLFRQSIFRELPLLDFSGKPVVFMDNIADIHMVAVKSLLAWQDLNEPYGLNAMEEEIIATLKIEDIESSRESVRRILMGYPPKDLSERRIYGIKSGLDFIADPFNRISEQSIHTLYQLAIEPDLSVDDRLLSGSIYRHDQVFVMGMEVEHTGIAFDKLPESMDGLIKFINTDDSINDLLKASMIHYYIAYLHPWTDGNGRMARLLHLWYLKQKGYSAALFIPFSRYVEKTRSQYYKSFTAIEDNSKISGILDITPFLVYFTDHVYHQISAWSPKPDLVKDFHEALSHGKITAKERSLWNFVLSHYGTEEFSTKKLERDFGNAAYATIRSFVLKFEEMGLLRVQQYGNRRKYQINV